MNDDASRTPDQNDFLSLVQVLCTLGCALLVYVLGLAVFSQPLGDLGAPFDKSAACALGLQGCLLGGFAVMHAVSYAKPDPYELPSGRRKKNPLIVGSLLMAGLALSMLAGALQPTRAAAIPLAEACFGASAGALMLSWGRIWGAVGHSESGAVLIARNTAISAFITVPLALLATLVPPWAAYASAAVAFLGSFALNLECGRRLDSHDLALGEKAAQSENCSGLGREAGSEAAASAAAANAAAASATAASAATASAAAFSRPRLITRASFTSLATGACFGAVFCYTMLAFGVPCALYVLAAATTLAGLWSLALTLRKTIPRVPEIEHITFLATGVCLVAICFVGKPLQLVLCVLASAFLVKYYIFNPNTLIAVSFFDRRLSSYHCARENVMSLFATVIMWTALAAMTLAGLSLEASTAIIALICVGLLLAEPLFTPFMTNRAIDQLVSCGEEPQASTENPGSSFAWQQRCVDICRTCELSPRETEVFMLLARGRNSAYVAENLVISPHTARTHIYRIYQKIGVSSRQELLDLVEGPCEAQWSE